jgi:hypothetical protein
MNRETSHKLLLVAALFNWMVGTALIVDAAWLMGLFRVTPLPTEPLFVYLFAWLVIVFGIGYYWSARDPVAYAPVIRLGVIGKLGVVAVVLLATLQGHTSWQMNIVSSADLVFAVLFIAVLRRAGT